jgi:anti-sigma regulatory factor (Ser/Thr protein kinase)
VDESIADTAWVTSARPPGPLTGDDHASRWAALVLDPDTSSVARARRWARETVEGWQADGQEWTVSQLLTEIVTNAVLHADTRFRVRLEQDLGTRRLRCEVTDTSAVRPRLRHHGAEATTGRGLQMVAELAQGWGVVAMDGGKTVWFELDADADLRRDSDAGFSAESWLSELASPSLTPPPTGARDLTTPANRARPGGTARRRPARLALPASLARAPWRPALPLLSVLSVLSQGRPAA